MAEEREKETDAMLLGGKSTGETTKETDSSEAGEDRAGPASQDETAADGSSSGASSECEPPVISESDEGTPTW